MQSDQESHSHHSDTIMDSWKLDYDDDVRENLEKDLPLKTGKTPNPEQWEMIKMRENNVCVCAGAGSGKTLSLIWRIVFLHAYLKVPLSNITVLSFTRKSVEEFREKLLEMLEKYDPNIDPALIDKTVRTFHSKILEFGRQSKFATTPDKMFEHLKAPEDVTESSYFSASEFRAENKSFTQLCQAISSAGYNVGVIGAPPDTIRWLNEILQVTDLLERMSTGWSKLSLTDEIKQLKRQSDNYRGEFFDKLYYNQQTVIKKLNRLLIELLYPDKVPAPINDSDDDEIVDHIFNRTRIPIEQSRILKDIYRHLFQNDPQFKELINRLYVSFLTKSNLYDSAKYTERERQDRILDAYSRDTRLSEVVHDMINGKYKSKKIKKFYLNNVDKPICFYANGYVKELSLYIVFIPDKKTLGYYASEEFDGQLSLKACLTIKDKLLHSGSDKDIRIIHNQQEMNIFEEKINSCLSDLASGNAPSFQFALTGDLIADDIWKVLFKAGVFIENSGLSVETIAGCINDPELDEHDRKFLRALIIFWRQLNETLRNSEKPLYRYHDLFEAFSERKNPH